MGEPPYRPLGRAGISRASGGVAGYDRSGPTPNPRPRLIESRRVATLGIGKDLSAAMPRKADRLRPRGTLFAQGAKSFFFTFWCP